MQKPIYVLGVGLSHDGSACLLKDGEVMVAIEKERLTRVKHDGGNDCVTVQYCLDAANVALSDIDLIVQAANFEKDEIRKDHYRGNRLFANIESSRIVTISHHLAHSFYAYGSSPFLEANVFVLDGCGSFYQQCDDLKCTFIPTHVLSEVGLYGEKDSYYSFTQNGYQPIYKDFSEIKLYDNSYPVKLPTSRHSIGGFYSMVSNYCFGSYDDSGKLMGLAPYGKKNIYTQEIFYFEENNLWINEEVLSIFTQPADSITHPFKDHFQYYADIAYWVQQETEKAIITLLKNRIAIDHPKKLCYTGGVALNAVANKKIITELQGTDIFITPAAGDNGLSMGCAYYGWLHLLQKQKCISSHHVYLGKSYDDDMIENTINNFISKNQHISCTIYNDDDIIAASSDLLNDKKVIGWFQQGAEFGPRALGNRSILAHPNINGIKDFINHHIKLREDFRPFAPSILATQLNEYFTLSVESPYMLMVNDIRDDKKNSVEGIVHLDGTCRVQTVTEENNRRFFLLLESFYRKSTIPILLNTSLNRKGMPIVETPQEAIDFFSSSALDCLVLHNFILQKK
jgi:carbamoyltransferase